MEHDPKPLGILFKSEMVRAILNSKTLCFPPEAIDLKQPFKGVTRRLIKFTGMHKAGEKLWRKSKESGRRWLLNDQPERLLGIDCLYAPVGRILWVKETFYRNSKDGFICYEATPRVFRDFKGKGRTWEIPGTDQQSLDQIRSNKAWKKIPSLLMDRASSRIDLCVVDRRAERLFDITEEDSKFEGVQPYSKATAFIEIQPLDGMSDYKAGYRELWNKINGEGSWDENPWVWRIAFLRRES